MTELRLNIAADINRLHDLAEAKADEAIGHAVDAGKLLLEAKAALPHGEWLGWLQANIWVTPRQVQRYMRVAQGKPLPIRAPAPKAVEPANTTSVSYLEVDAPRMMPGGAPDEPPQFVPDASLCYATHLAPDGPVYLVEPSSRHPGFFFVSRLNDETYDCTRRPIGSQWVEFNLQYYGLAEPAGAAWRVKESAGVLTATETFDGVAA